MRGLLPLTKDTIDKLHADVPLRALMGGQTSFVYTERPPDGVTTPFAVLDFTQIAPWNNQTFQGSEIVTQVSVFFLRTEQGSSRGILDAAKAVERIRIALDYVDDFDLAASPTSGASASRLILRQYVSSLPPTTDPDGRFMQAACRFRCLVGASN